jgi:hypothetical protein
MKKVFVFGFISTVLLMFISCTQEESVNFQSNTGKDTSIAERFAICKEIAIYHSEGLKFIYDKLYSNVNQGERNTTTHSIVAEFMSQEHIKAGLSKYGGKLNLEEINAANPTVSFRGGGLTQTTPISILENTVKNIESIAEIEPRIEAAFSTKEFLSLPEAEQNQLLLMFAVYMDSFNYWNENILDWVDPDDHDLHPSRSWKAWAVFIGAVALADAKGGTISGAAGAAGGAAGGAVTGAIAGGIGAGAGAAGGAVGGGVAGGVSGAITASISYIEDFNAAGSSANTKK